MLNLPIKEDVRNEIGSYASRGVAVLPVTREEWANMISAAHPLLGDLLGNEDLLDGGVIIVDAAGHITAIPMGTAGQVLTVNAAGDGLEFKTPT